MKDIINGLQEQLDAIYGQDWQYDRIGIEHGSADQTRAIAIESIFKQVIGNVQSAIDQLKILDKHMH